MSSAVAELTVEETMNIPDLATFQQHHYSHWLKRFDIGFCDCKPAEVAYIDLTNLSTLTTKEVQIVCNHGQPHLWTRGITLAPCLIKIDPEQPKKKTTKGMLIDYIRALETHNELGAPAAGQQQLYLYRDDLQNGELDDEDDDDDSGTGSKSGLGLLQPDNTAAGEAEKQLIRRPEPGPLARAQMPDLDALADDPEPGARLAPGLRARNNRGAWGILLVDDQGDDKLAQAPQPGLWERIMSSRCVSMIHIAKDIIVRHPYHSASDASWILLAIYTKDPTLFLSAVTVAMPKFFKSAAPKWLCQLTTHPLAVAFPKLLASCLGHTATQAWAADAVLRFGLDATSPTLGLAIPPVTQLTNDALAVAQAALEQCGT